MSYHNDQVFREAIRRGLHEQYQRGLYSGAYAMCVTIRAKADDEKHTPEERLQSIIQFCDTMIKPKKPIEVEPEAVEDVAGDAAEDAAEKAEDGKDV